MQQMTQLTSKMDDMKGRVEDNEKNLQSIYVGT